MTNHNPNSNPGLNPEPDPNPDMRGEYSCRCHGKRVISAPSKPLKLAGHIL